MITINKERISQLSFSTNDVLRDEQLKQKRKSLLKKAEQLGNAYKRKAKILFNSIEGTFRVETTVWATTEHFVALKGGILIPINQINQVEFY